MRGYIYILQTTERPDVLKIGKTTLSPAIRCRQHNEDWYLSINTWNVAHWRWVENCNRAESEIHRALKRHNIRAKGHREAFRVGLPTALDVVCRVCDIYPPKGDGPSVKPLRKRRVLDELAYKHVSRQGSMTLQLLNFKKTLSDADFYRWLEASAPYL